MKVVGIDLSGPRNFADTVLVSFEEKGNEIHLQNVREGANDEMILETLLGLEKGEQIILGITRRFPIMQRGETVPLTRICGVFSKRRAFRRASCRPP